MVKFRVFCFLVVVFAGGTGAFGQVICLNGCNQLPAGNYWNDSSGACYKYTDVYGEKMYSKTPIGGTSGILTTSVSRLKYNGCTVICSATPNPQIMTGGGMLTEQKTVFNRKCSNAP